MEYDLMSACYKVVSRKPELYVFSRGTDLERFVVKITGVPPYFYAPYGEVPEEFRGHPLLDFNERAVVKLLTEYPGQVKTRRGAYSFTDEADVEYEKRVLTDRNIYCGFKIENNDIVPTPSHNILPRVAVGDIEVFSPPEIMPQPENPIYPVVSIAFRDSYTGRKTLFLLESRAKVYWPATELEEVVYCRTEWELFNLAAEYCLQNRFDIWTGWWWKNYDVPYLRFRSTRINFDFRKFSPIHEARIKRHPKKKRVYFVKIGGLETTDLLEQYRVLTKPEGQRLAWDLKFIVKEETKGKLIPRQYCGFCENEECEFRGVVTEKPEEIKCRGFMYTDYGDVIEIVHAQDHRTMIRYCFNDVDAAYLVDQVRGLTKHYDVARRLRGCFISDAHSAYRVHKSFLLRLTNKPLPTNFFGFTDRLQRVTGAFVMDPVPGLHEYVGVMDIHAIYPMLIENLNASPETKSDDGTLVAANGTRFKKSPKGLFPRAVNLLRGEREGYQQAMAALQSGTPEWELMWTKQESTKYDVRSFYGATRNVDPDVTQAITATGQFILKQRLIPYIRSLDYEVVYGDTDSAHAKFKTVDWREGLLLEEAINKYLLKVSEELKFEEPLEIKFEKFFRRIFYKTKKRWAGFCTIRDKQPYNKLIVMGLEAKRSDSAIVTVRAMKDYMLAVNMEGDLEKAVAVLRDVYQTYKDLPMTDIGVPKGLQMELDAYDHFLMAEAVKWSMKHLRIRFRQDKKPRLIYGYVKGKPFPKLTKRKTRAFAIQDEPVEGAVIDYPLMIKKTLEDKFDPLLKAVGLDWTSVTSTSRPSQLTRWFETARV